MKDGKLSPKRERLWKRREIEEEEREERRASAKQNFANATGRMNRSNYFRLADR